MLLAVCCSAGCLAHSLCEQQLRADVWRLELENSSLRRELDSVRQEEESCRAQLNDLHEAYFSLQQCLGKRVQRLQVRTISPERASQCPDLLVTLSAGSSTAWEDQPREG